MEHYSIDPPKGFVTRIPCSSVNGAAVKCIQCFKANIIRVFWRKKPIVYTGSNVLR